MQHTLMHRFFSWLKRRTTISMLVGFVVTLALVLSRQFLISRDLVIFGERFVDYTDLILVVLFASLNGPIAGSVLSFCIFFITSVQAGAFSFVVFPFMLASLLAYLPVYHRWYKTKKKTFFAILYFAFFLGAVWGFVFALVMELPMGVMTVVFPFITAIPSCTVAVLLCYGFFNYAPAAVKCAFSCGAFYLDECGRATVQQMYLGTDSRIKRKITWLIISMAVVLVIGAICMANMIMCDMRDHMHHMAGYLFHSPHGLSPRESGISLDPRLKDFFLTDIKLVLLLLNGAIPLSLIANWYAQEHIAMPIFLMSKAMNDFTRTTVDDDVKSVLDIHLLPIKTNDEIQDLHETLKKTASDMSGYIERLQHERQLQEDLKVAQAASKAKSTFLSNMSHEIRTPINAVLGFDEMILREATDPVILDYAQDIRTSGKTLLSLINDILDFSKIEAGKMEILPVQYELSSAINDLVNMIQIKADDKHLALNVNIDKSMPHLLFGDEVRLKQCILNILTNAVKYTHTGSVTLNMHSTKTGDDTIDLFVQIIDTGIGIKQEDVQKLFTAFERIEEKRNRSIEGTGLGMNIVQQLLSMMGSSLTVKSEYGKGSDFSFTVRQKVLSWEPIGDVATMYRRSLATETTYRETFTAPDASILVVDDTPLNLKVMQGLLKQTQMQIDTAESGQLTLGLVQKKRYDVIFIDHRMPGMDGVETLHEMQRLEHNKNAGVPCIALTANAISGAREYYLMEGFTDYLSKPIDAAKLEHLLKKYIPHDKVHVVQSAVSVSADPNATADGAPRARTNGEEAASFPVLEGIDLAEALKNCGGAETLREAFKDFYASIATKSAQIADYAAAQDWKNYTVLVHALKSSARLIGAGALSEDARQLEACGDQAQTEGAVADEARSVIAEKTPALLALYQSYAQKLAPVAAVSAECAGKTPITQATLDAALSDLREVVSAFDFGTADAIVEQLDACQLPASFAEQWKAIKQAVANVDQAAVMALLEHDV